MNLIEASNLSTKQAEMVLAAYEPTPSGLNNPILFAGGAAGGGKSAGLAYFSIDYAIRNYEAGCREIPQLLTSLRLNMLKKRFGPHYAKYRDLGEIRGEGRMGPGFYFHNTDLGYVMFGHLADPMQYRGFNACNNLVDEFTELPPIIDDTNILTLLGIPIRSDHKVISNPLVLASNWDGVGYYNARTLFWDKKSDRHKELIESLDFGGEGRIEERLREVFFTIDDNPNKSVRDQYIAQLAGLPEHIRKSRRYGMPEHPSGAMFRHIEDSTVELSQMFPSGIPRRFSKIGGQDWGDNAPFACMYGAIDWEGERVFIRGEQYQRRALDHEQAEMVLGGIMPDERYEYIIGDPNMFHSGARNSGTGMRGSVPADVIGAAYEADRGSDQGGKRILGGLIPGNNARITGFRWLQHLMAPKPHGWQLYIDRKCRNLLRELEGAVYDRRPTQIGSEELDGACSDHALDALRYLCMEVRSVDEERKAEQRLREETASPIFDVQLKEESPMVAQF